MKKKVIAGATEETQNYEIDLSEITKLLGIISRTLGVLAVRLSITRPKTKGERASFLNSIGFDRNEIAAILASKPKTISVHLSQRRKTKKRKGNKRGKN
jgi:hypothetical protein